MSGSDIGASVRARLLNKARAEGQDFNLILTRFAEFDGTTLAKAIRAAFNRRATPIPVAVPFGLSADFSVDGQKQTQWRAFLSKNALEPVALDVVLALLRSFLDLPLSVARSGETWSASWARGGDWR